jgi:predicted nucleic acid-binding protein
VILVDSSVWIDYFRAIDSGPATLLDSLFGRAPLLVGDLIAAEVLQGVASDSEFRHVKRVLDEFEHLDLSSYDLAVKASQNYRLLRSKGPSIR